MQASLANGIVFGDYYLLGRLNRGGMAEVFLARSRVPRRTRRLLALKRMLPEHLGSPEFADMFRDEASIARNLRHPNICQTLDASTVRHQPFMVMEFVHGKDLKVVLQRMAVDLERPSDALAAYVVACIADGLHHAHQQRDAQGQLRGVVHRDVSPHNILISYDGVPKLIDFGIAKAKDRIARTQAGVVKGKLAYMSPEQVSDEPVDHRADIFSLGAVLYELVTGRSAFRGGKDLSTLQRISSVRYADPRVVRPTLAPGLIDVIDKALRRRPEERYASAAALATELRSVLREMPDEAGESALAAMIQGAFASTYNRERGKVAEYLAAAVPLLSPEELVQSRASNEGSSVTQTQIDALDDATDIAPSTGVVEAPTVQELEMDDDMDDEHVREITHTELNDFSGEAATVEMTGPSAAMLEAWARQGSPSAESSKRPRPVTGAQTKVLGSADEVAPKPERVAPSPLPDDWAQQAEYPLPMAATVVSTAAPRPASVVVPRAPLRGARAPLARPPATSSHGLSRGEWRVIFLVALLGTATVAMVYTWRVEIAAALAEGQ